MEDIGGRNRQEDCKEGGCMEDRWKEKVEKMQPAMEDRR